MFRVLVLVKELQEKTSSFTIFKIARHFHIEKTNGAKLNRFLIKGGTTVLRRVFNDFYPPLLKLAANLQANRPILNNLFRWKKVNRGRIFFLH